MLRTCRGGVEPFDEILQILKSLWEGRYLWIITHDDSVGALLQKQYQTSYDRPIIMNGLEYIDGQRLINPMKPNIIECCLASNMRSSNSIFLCPASAF